MTSTRNLLRTVVLQTNPYWPFTHCNRWPYEGALYLFVRALRARPEIRSIYLRAPRQHAWIPGLSDIDLTLVLQGGLSAEREYDILGFVWRTYAQLKRVFPMLGEVEILDEEEVLAWLRWTNADSQGANWILRHGQPNQHVQAAPSRHWRRRALITALWIYAVHLPSCLVQRDSSLRRHDILRRVKKMLRVLEAIFDEVGPPPLASPAKSIDPAELVAGALKALEAAVSLVTPTGPRDRRPEKRRDSVLITPKGQRMLVVDDGLDRELLAERLRSVWSGTFGPGPAPLVLPHCLLAYWVRHFEPKDYEKLRGAVAVEGSHPLADIAPPGRSEFAAHAMDRVFHLPIFVRGAELFSQPLSPTSLRNQLNSALGAINFLRNGWTLPYPGEDKDDQRWRKEFPRYVAPFEEVLVLLREHHSRAAHQAAFALVRSILIDARDVMSLELR